MLRGAVHDAETSAGAAGAGDRAEHHRAAAGGVASGCRVPRVSARTCSGGPTSVTPNHESPLRVLEHVVVERDGLSGGVLQTRTAVSYSIRRTAQIGEIDINRISEPPTLGAGQRRPRQVAVAPRQATRRVGHEPPCHDQDDGARQDGGDGSEYRIEPAMLAYAVVVLRRSRCLHSRKQEEGDDRKRQDRAGDCPAPGAPAIAAGHPDRCEDWDAPQDHDRKGRGIDAWQDVDAHATRPLAGICPPG